MVDTVSAKRPVSMEELLSLAAPIRDAVRRHHGTGKVMVFGSVARGDADAESDVDLLVEFTPDATLFDLAGLELSLEGLLGRPVDVMSMGSQGRAVQHALRQALPLT